MGPPGKLPSGIEGKKKSWDIFKDFFLRVQELSVPTCKKLGKESQRG